ncbi:hypothetical protein Glove_457g41 [Diversispora epigaea]|uniref:Zn-finger domain-containing protein n=1 Tax=Diversispora epigaea TaxID=1348612 RepID=A0A397GXK9_9GLOM|nr:hypothetical protein Glove_457g41 [Diversispora epigaea]
MMIDSLESENLLNNENNFENIHENSNEDEGEGENEDKDNDSYNAEVEEESLTSDISHSSVSFFENMELSNSEPENYSFNNYASDYNNICEEAEPIEFPNNAYADLMALITNYNLSNEATNAVIHFFNEHSNLPLSPFPKNAKKGHELMEKMKIPTLTSKKHKILTHNNIDYYLFYHPVLNCIKNILSISDISQNFTLRFENFKYKGEKAYSEQYTGNWWKNTEASLPHGSNLLSIILYSDATTTDTLGRELMEKMKIPTLTSKKHKILTHNNIDYYLFYHPVLNCIKNILSISDISQNFTLRFENFKYKGEKAYSEQYTGNWWKNTEASLPHGSNLLSIILYSDATTTDTLGKSSLHPIYISIGNISTKRRNKSDAKQLLGYLPILKAKDKSEKKSKDFKKLVRLTFHNSMKFLLDPLFTEKGIDLEVDNKTFWFFPRISTIICDWPEAATFSLVYKSTNSNFPCHFCLISKTLLADTDLSDVTFRNNENMQEYFYNNAGQDVSLENIPNYFWSLPSINVYSATVPDRMHHLDLGLFHYQIEFTQALLQKQDSSLVNKIDNRLSKIPQFQKFQMFTNGLQSISRMTAKEYRILMKVMVFVVDNLYKENENNVENFVENKKLSEVYAKWNKMYMMSRSEIFTESDLENFRKDTFEWAKLFVEIFKPYSRSKLKFPKFHSWIYHIFESIRQFGIINGYTTETYESLHKDFVKIPYRMSNKKNVEDQIMKTLKRQDIINVINKKQKKKKLTKLLNFSSKLFETKLTEANIYFCEKMNDPNINDNMIKGFNQFLECFDDFLDNILEVKNIKECDIIIYAISMDSNESSDYQSDEGLCYGKILLMAKIEIEEKPPLNLALVQWYDFKFEKNSYLYNCPLLKLVELYNLIPIETIDNIVHIIPRFDEDNEYFVNKYIS